MNIVIATPLYPPDVAPSARYAKELAKRLSANHEVTVVTYAHVPEKIPGVRILHTEKRRPLLIRLTNFTIRLTRALYKADLLIVENGMSVEFPVLIATNISACPFIFSLSDQDAHIHTGRSFFRGFIERRIRTKARAILSAIPGERPEILPFRPEPTEALAAYEDAWVAHLAQYKKYGIHE